MSGFAMFSLKDPSLLAFDERRVTDSNLKSIYSIEHVSSDTQMRAILDDVEPAGIRPVFRDALRLFIHHCHLEPHRPVGLCRFFYSKADTQGSPAVFSRRTRLFVISDALDEMSNLSENPPCILEPELL